MTTPTDLQLQLALVKMLPDKIDCFDESFYWIQPNRYQVRDTEWLHVCWLVEQTLEHNDGDCEYHRYWNELDHLGPPGIIGRRAMLSASWQQRALALCKVKGVEIV